MLVKDRMTPQPLFVVTRDTPIIDAQRLMQEHRIRHLPVVEVAPVAGEERRDRLVGLLTRESMLQAVPWSATALSTLETQFMLSRVKAGKTMIVDLVTITEDLVVEEAACIMVDHKIGCLPVVRDGILVGIITDTDLLGTMVEMVGARLPGVRLSVTVPNRPGAMARLSSAIAGVGGNLTAFSTWETRRGPERLGVVLKVAQVSRDQLADAVTKLEEVNVLDIRGG